MIKRIAHFVVLLVALASFVPLHELALARQDTSDCDTSISFDDYFSSGVDAYSEVYYEDAYGYFLCAEQVAIDDVQLSQAIAWQGITLSWLVGDEEAIPYYEQALALNPENFDALDFWGWSLQYLEQDADAIEKFTQSLQINPENDWTLPKRGISYFWTDQYDLAIADFDAALALNPEISEAYEYRGYSYLLSGKPDVALTDIEIALGYNPENSFALMMYGYALQLLGDNENAILFFDQAESLGLDHPLLYSLRGASYFYLENDEAALEDQNRVLEYYAQEDIEPDPYLLADANFYTGASYYFTGDYETAVNYFSQSIGFAGTEDAWSYALRGKSYVQLGQTDLALADFQMADEIDHDNEFFDELYGEEYESQYEEEYEEEGEGEYEEGDESEGEYEPEGESELKVSTKAKLL